ncbi:MAG: 30S ribosomal protein S20 [Chthoniobacterales bacterium]
MANTKSAAKRTRQTARRALRNSSISSQLRTLQKRALAAAKGDPNQIRCAISAIDKAAKRGAIHRNAAIRRKARLIKALASAK